MAWWMASVGAGGKSTAVVAAAAAAAVGVPWRGSSPPTCAQTVANGCRAAQEVLGGRAELGGGGRAPSGPARTCPPTWCAPQVIPVQCEGPWLCGRVVQARQLLPHLGRGMLVNRTLPRLSYRACRALEALIKTLYRLLQGPGLRACARPARSRCAAPPLCLPATPAQLHNTPA